MNKQEIKNNCIMPEMPYCPCCKYGYVEYYEDNDTDTVWHCLKGLLRVETGKRKG
jgi:hypothetical protein